jgi:transcriptional regulator with GAF, ATPase, and Fis domain
MDPFDRILLAVWREACRHIDIGKSTATIAQMLARHLPLGHILVRRIDLPHRAIETVAAGSVSKPMAASGVRTVCTGPQFKRLLSWLGTHRIERGNTRKRLGGLAAAISPGLEGEVLLGPLASAAGPAGVLILAADAGSRFEDRHARIAEALVEPFAAALENDRRLHELTSLREAAEADRRSLLTRLGRRELSETVVGAQSGLRPVMERVELVSRSDVPVLILGETGTGKEVVARAIHARSERATGAFIRVNCGAIPPELIDSHLFGHERGSFTGAIDTRQGWFERADGGTLFLDEIGELPLAAQVRLLRVLQDGYVERVGGQTPLRVDVRIVAATHRDLAAMVKTGGFREDLWYRVAVFPILLPPLRDRLEDIPDLARHFAEKAATRFGLMLVLPSLDDLRLMTLYAWPGNIRELAAVIDRAAILGNGKSLEVAKALGVGPQVVERAAIQPQALPTIESRGETIATLDQAMASHIATALRATRGKVEGVNGAAALLKINPHTLRARMRKLKVDWVKFRDPIWKAVEGG